MVSANICMFGAQMSKKDANHLGSICMNDAHICIYGANICMFSANPRTPPAPGNRA